MKSFIRRVAIALSLLLFLNLYLYKPDESGLQKPSGQTERQRHMAPEKPPVKPAEKRDGIKYERGSIYLYQSNKLIANRLVERLVARGNGLDSPVLHHLFGWQNNPSWANVFASAPNVQNRHRVVNSYLVGYSPFKTDNVWIPLLTLSQRKRYQFDHLQYSGRKEVWQTSKEAFDSPTGDCEDHAIALADWLIDMGEDARVVIGTMKNSGHAWVVLFKDGQEFLLEATWKLKKSPARHYPLASLFTDYHPMYMFNRSDFWFNQGPARTTDYASKKWVRKSRYN